MIKQQILNFLILILSCITPLCAVSSSEAISQSLKQSPDIENGRKIYALCANCHLDNGWGKPDGSFPVIAGQHPNVMLKQMDDIRSRNRENPTMYPFSDAKTIGGEQAIIDVITYIAALKPSSSPGKGDGTRLAEGKKLYQQRCQQCHGNKAQGNNEALYPKLQGQHYAYLLRQLKGIRDGYRKNSNPVMNTEVKPLADNELEAVADYLSRL
ncbi:MAG: c-type cytochrome [Gammaproteobacteria bacterium]|nr:c-type cytochrome [Gammaproteobacteria bacterium]MDH5734978.1 c-type cytochrome [Gammaproteobacteria bacterium]